MNCLFFKETHKSVTSVRGYHVTKEVGIEKDTLGNCDHNSEHYAWTSLFQKEKQMHTFIFSFLEQMVDPTMVTL